MAKNEEEWDPIYFAIFTILLVGFGMFLGSILGCLWEETEPSIEEGYCDMLADRLSEFPSKIVECDYMLIRRTCLCEIYNNIRANGVDFKQLVESKEFEIGV